MFFLVAAALEAVDFNIRIVPSYNADGAWVYTGNSGNVNYHNDYLFFWRRGSVLQCGYCSALCR